MALNETHKPKGNTMSDSNETVEQTEYYQVRINKKIVKKAALVAAAVAAVTGAVLIKKNLSIETTDNSVTVEKKDVNSV